MEKDAKERSYKNNIAYIAAAVILTCAFTIAPIYLSSVLKKKPADGDVTSTNASFDSIFTSYIPFQSETVSSLTEPVSSEAVSSSPGKKNRVIAKPQNYVKPVEKDKYEKPAKTYEKPVAVKPKKILDVPYINQTALYPTGCESVSAVMALKFAGYSISVNTFIDDFLDRAPAPYIATDGKRYGYDPNEYFLGDPYKQSGWGCKAPVIVNALNRYIDHSRHTVSNITGTTLKGLRKYIDKGIPVIVWATQGMAPTRVSKTWNIVGTDRTYTWISPNHCLLLVGYDSDGYYFNDPLTHKNCRYAASVAENRYTAMGKQAIVILQKETEKAPEVPTESTMSEVTDSSEQSDPQTDESEEDFTPPDSGESKTEETEEIFEN